MCALNFHSPIYIKKQQKKFVGRGQDKFAKNNAETSQVYKPKRLVGTNKSTWGYSKYY